MRKAISFALALSVLAAAPAVADERVPVSLRGSPASMERQNAVAKENHLEFVRTAAELAELEREGELVRMDGNGDYTFAAGVSGPVARPEVRTFVERLSAQYREGCGERLVVTSLTRPTSRQPGNAHPLSVHPAGMAVDLRISQKADCRGWLEGTLLTLERGGVLDVTREANPPHYHVALFPDAYRGYLDRLEAEREAAAAAAQAEEMRAAAAAARAALAAVAPAPAPVMASAVLAPSHSGDSSGGDGSDALLPVALALAACFALTRLRAHLEM